MLILDDAGQYENQSGDRWQLVSTGERYPNYSAKIHEATRLALERCPETEAIAVWDDDDIYLPGHLAAINEALGEASAARWCQHERVWTDGGDSRGPLHSEEGTTGYHATWGVTLPAFRASGGWPDTDRSDCDQGFRERLLELVGPPVVRRGAATFVRRLFIAGWSNSHWGTGNHVARTEALPRGQWRGLIVPRFDQNTRRRFRELLTGEELPAQFAPTPPVETLNLEYHVSHACNLACSNCSHLSDQKHRGLSSAAEADRQFSLWSSRVGPRQFGLVGGEPTLNPELTQIVHLARRHWPETDLQLVTNGFFLHRHPELPRTLEETGCRLEISVHHHSAEYQERIAPIRELVADWERAYWLGVCWRDSAGTWTRWYRGSGREMRPYADGDPAASWSVCMAKHCPQIHEGRLWKCPPMAYLPMQAAKYGLDQVEEWRPYLDYRPLKADCTDDELREFLSRGVESCCGACPAKSELFELPNPLRRANA